MISVTNQTMKINISLFLFLFFFFMKVETFDKLQQRIPERIVEHAVRGMLPKGRVSSEVL